MKTELDKVVSRLDTMKEEGHEGFPGGPKLEELWDQARVRADIAVEVTDPDTDPRNTVAAMWMEAIQIGYELCKMVEEANV